MGIKRFFLDAFSGGELAGISTGLFVVRDRSGRLIAAAAVSRIALTLDCIAPMPVQRAAAMVRSVLPRFLEFELLMCGLPASLADTETAFAPGLSRPVLDLARRALIEKSLWVLERERLGACVWKEFDRDALPDWRAPLESRGFCLFPSVPVSVQAVDFDSPQAYVGRLRAPYRRQLAANLARAAAAGLSIESGLDLAAYVGEFLPLYLQVLGRSKTRLETLSLRFFTLLAREPRIRYIRATMNGRPVGGAICFVDAPSVLVFLYVGMEYEVMRSCDLYFNLLKAIVDLAAASGVRQIRWGQTSPDAKGRMGASLAPLVFAMRFRRSALQRLLVRTGGVLFPERGQIERRVLKEGCPR